MFNITRSSEQINGNGGLALVGLIFRDLSLDEQLNNVRIRGVQKEPEISNADVVRSYCGLLVMGKTAYEDIEAFRHNKFFRKALEINNVPSAATLRQRFEAAEGRFDNVLRRLNVELLKRCEINPVDAEKGKYMPLDMDVSPMDNANTEKEHVSRTYKGTDGYAPNLTYIGVEGYMIEAELRPGRQHSQKGTPQSLKEILDFVDELNLPYATLVRLDSGYDAGDTINVLEGRVRYLVKRNLRNETLESWLALAKENGTCRIEREGKAVYTGDTYRWAPSKDGSEDSRRIVFKVIERTISADGQPLLVPDIEVETWWTDLVESPDEVIRLYEDHGTSEQFHSELKSDMGVERLPSGKFAANYTVVSVAMLAFNILRKTGQAVLSVGDCLPVKTKSRRRRLRSVIQDIIYIGCKYVRTGNRDWLKLGIDCAWFTPFKLIYEAWA